MASGQKASAAPLPSSKSLKSNAAAALESSQACYGKRVGWAKDRDPLKPTVQMLPQKACAINLTVVAGGLTYLIGLTRLHILIVMNVVRDL